MHPVGGDAFAQLAPRLPDRNDRNGPIEPPIEIGMILRQRWVFQRISSSPNGDRAQQQKCAVYRPVSRNVTPCQRCGSLREYALWQGHRRFPQVHLARFRSIGGKPGDDHRFGGYAGSPWGRATPVEEWWAIADTFDGRVHVEWHAAEPVTRLVSWRFSSNT